MSLAADLHRLAVTLERAAQDGGLAPVPAAAAAREVSEAAERAAALEARLVPPGSRLAEGSGVVDLADARHRKAVAAWLAGDGRVVIDGGQL